MSNRAMKFAAFSAVAAVVLTGCSSSSSSGAAVRHLRPRATSAACDLRRRRDLRRLGRCLLGCRSSCHPRCRSAQRGGPAPARSA